MCASLLAATLQSGVFPPDKACPALGAQPRFLSLPDPVRLWRDTGPALFLRNTPGLQPKRKQDSDPAEKPGERQLWTKQRPRPILPAGSTGLSPRGRGCMPCWLCTHRRDCSRGPCSLGDCLTFLKPKGQHGSPQRRRSGGDYDPLPQLENESELQAHGVGTALQAAPPCSGTSPRVLRASVST